MIQALVLGLALLTLANGSTGTFPFVAAVFDGCVREAMSREQVTKQGAHVLCEYQLGKDFRDALLAHRRQVFARHRISRCVEQQIAEGFPINRALTACADTTLSPTEPAHE
jgi:hypothetical protein